MKLLLILCAFLLPNVLFAQVRRNLKAFYNADSTLVGYQDRQGKVIVPLSLQAVSRIPSSFDNIISVTEVNDQEEFRSYFLTKTGRKVGNDSLYYFDNVPDCESEGFIRFYDQANDLVGLLNAEGEIQIPATYNGLGRVKNGMIPALKGAQRKRDSPDDEHSYFVGGKSMLIDTNNQVLIEDFPYNDNLNFYQVSINGSLPEDGTWEKFKGKNGNTYAFMDYVKEFEQLFPKLFSKEITKERLISHSYDSIAYWHEDQNQWVFEESPKYINRQGDILKELFESVISGSKKYDISKSSLNYFIFEGESYSKYLDQCGDSLDAKYPVISLSLYDEFPYVSKTFEFLRTDEGYKLILVNF
ncbi:hypothetical protein [Sphingobacterium mizutaii]|uniref:hypothetical protein n=1 Tax=Sphingobacterium mizutaii TaxID=1010 RepID=UPI002897E4BA|nr:hypothetical protein [Sphingobacterium mizutaii]